MFSSPSDESTGANAEVDGTTNSSPESLDTSLSEPSARVTGKTRLQRYDSFTLSALRRKVHQYYIRNEEPTVEKILSEVIGDTFMGLPKQLSVRTMRRLLNDIGFSFRKQKRNCALLERDDIIVWRRKYLRTIREMRKEKRIPRGRMAVLEKTLAAENEIRAELLREEHAIRVRLLQEDHDDMILERADKRKFDNQVRELELLKHKNEL
ncbi:hypothetical protein MTO96_049252 [Rhipicephalus appendiculatus]